MDKQIQKYNKKNKVALTFFITFLIILSCMSSMYAYNLIYEKINLVTVDDISISPDLNISYFGNYNIYTNITSDDTIETVLCNITGINGEGFYAWNYYVNGTPYCDNITKEMDYVSGNMYRTAIRPDDIYPEIFFAPNEITWSNVPLNMNLYRQNYQLFHFNNSFEIINGTNIWIEFNAVPNSVSSPPSSDLQVYIVEQGHDASYFNFDWRASNETELIGTVKSTDSFDHTHSANSSHHTILVTTHNNTVGDKALNISEDFWVVLYSPSNTIAKGWTLKYHSNLVANNINNWYRGAQSGWTRTYQSGIPDAHVHVARQGVINDGVNITIWAKDSDGNTTTFYQEYTFEDLPNLPPNPTYFITPESGTSSGIINISWYPANDPNNDPLTYNLTLLNVDKTFNSVLETNTNLTYFMWNTTEVGNGYYDLMVTIYDGELSSNFTLSANFTHSGTYDEFRIFNDVSSPTANAGTDLYINENITVMLNGSGSSDDTGIVNYTWMFNDSGTNVILYNVYENYTFITPGIYNITLTVYDIENKTDFDIIQIVVNDSTNPVANAGLNQTVYTNITVIFNGSLSYDNIGITNYTWTFTYNNTNIILYGITSEFNFEYNGTYIVILNVTDYAGNWNINNIIIIINTPPTIIEILIELLITLGPVIIIFSILGVIIKSMKKQIGKD